MAPATFQRALPGGLDRPARGALHFDLIDLRLFVHIAEASSLTGGAERSCLSLPAASTRVKHLEEAVGAKLLYRGAHGVTLTAPGQAFVQHARLVLNQLEHLRGDLLEYARGLRGRLRVCASTSAIAEFLPPVLRDYLAAHPDVGIDLRERPSSDIVRAVGDGSTDIGIVSGDVRVEGLQVWPYRDDRIVVAVPMRHPLAAQSAVAFAETLGWEHIGLGDASALHAFVLQRARDLHADVRLRIQVGNFEAACRFIEAGIGIGLLPHSAARRHAQTMSIRVLPLTDEWALRRLHVVVRSFDLLPAFGRALVERLVADGRNAR